MSWNGPEDAKQMILDFISDLEKVEIFQGSEEQGDLNIVRFFFSRMHPEMVMHHLIDKVLPHKKQISSRSEKFFLRNQTIFAGLPDDRIRYYSEVVAKGKGIHQEDREAIWNYFDSFVTLAECYKKNK